MDTKMNHEKEMNHVETAALGCLPREARRLLHSCIGLSRSLRKKSVSVKFGKGTSSTRAVKRFTMSLRFSA